MSKVTVPAGAGAPLRLRVPPDARYGRYVRERVGGFAVTYGVPSADVDEFVIAVSEAVANAIEHSRSPDTIEIACWVVGSDQLVATVVDHGVGFAVDETIARAAQPDGLAERGRGLPIMRRYTDTFSVESTPGKGTAVILGRYVRHRPGAGAAALAG